MKIGLGARRCRVTVVLVKMGPCWPVVVPKPVPPAPSPELSPAPAPAPTQQPTPGITAYFIAVGDWGYNEWCHGNVRPGCQRVIAEEMKDFMDSEGDRIKFIVNLSDSFYCDGVCGNDER